jgi:adenylate cyclase
MLPIFMTGDLRLGLPISLLIVFLSALVFGTAFFILGAIREIIKIPSFGLNLLAQTGLISLTVAVASILVMWLSMSLGSKVSPLDHRILAAMADALWKPLAAVFLGVGVFIAFLINAVFQIDHKLGPGVLWNWITGKYYKPREEERIFMFLDIKGSTTIAEKLGNLLFSELVRDFFRDMTYPVLETKGEVSHFIGDEAVLTWRPEKGFAKANCVEMFYKMQKVIEDRSVYYTNKYGFVPEFKAGIHVGRVVATEVGEIKSEIVFHGDVLNTAARIQSLCNEEGHALLLSADVAERLGNDSRFQLTSLGEKRLKGKEHEIGLYAAEIKAS